MIVDCGTRGPNGSRSGSPFRQKPSRAKFFDFIQQQGYLRVWIDGEIVRADSDKKSNGSARACRSSRIGSRFRRKTRAPCRSDRNRAPFRQGPDQRRRGTRSNRKSRKRKFRVSAIFPSRPAGIARIAISTFVRPPGLFSFNNPLGACPECRGFGRTIAIDLNKAIPDRSLSIAQGAVRVFRGEEMGESQKDLLRACAREEIDVRIPFEELPKAIRISSSTARSARRIHRCRGLRERSLVRRPRIFQMAREQDLQNARARFAQPLSRLHDLSELQRRPFQPETLNYKIVASATDREMTARARSAYRLNACRNLRAFRFPMRAIFRTIGLPPNDSTAEMLRDEVVRAAPYLCEVGLGYLTLDRSTRTLSGGEVQRVNLTTCLGASLVNTLFVMDEPSVGLHPRDVGRLVRVMHDLRDKGNTLLVVEHEEAIIRAPINSSISVRAAASTAASWFRPLDQFVGSGARRRARSRCAEENVRQMRSNAREASAGANPIADARLSHRRKIDSGSEIAPQIERRDQDHRRARAQSEEHRRRYSARRFHLRHRRFRFRQIDAHPRRALPASAARQGTASSDQEPGACKSVTGAHRIGEVVMVDQAQLARTPRSTPILYLGFTIGCANCSPRSRKRWRRD
jgi:excinuclease ABC subunit A